MNGFLRKLDNLKERGRYRSLKLPCGIDLTSNDYLGLRSHPKLKATAIAAIENGIDMGAGGSRLLRGHTTHHENLENFAAGYFGAEKSLYFANGYTANLALFTTLPARGDTIIFDELIHASARDGIQASSAKHIRVLHNDLNAYEDALKKAEGQRWIAVEAVYSMDGDLAPLQELHALAQQYDAMLIVDEAHATGIFGASGKGLSEGLPHENLIILHTCGKALGVAGGLVCASAAIIDTLVNRARPFIYSTAPPPLQALLVQTALEIVRDEPERRQALHKRMHYAGSIYFLHGRFGNHFSPILPIIIGDDAKAVEIAQALQDAGFDIRAIRPPSVPEGTARLRLALNINVDEKTLQQFSDALLPHLQRRAA